MNKNSKRKLIALIIIIVILVILLLRTCHSCNEKSTTQPSIKIDTLSLTIEQGKDTFQNTKDSLNKVQEQNIHQSKPEIHDSNKKNSLLSKTAKNKIKSHSQIEKMPTSSAIRKDSLRIDSHKLSKDTVILNVEDSNQKTVSKTTVADLKEDTGILTIQVRKPSQDTLMGMEYVNHIKRFFSSVIIDFEGLDKNKKNNHLLKEITHFKVFVKMATEQPLSNDFIKKIFVRISDSTTGKLILFKDLSTMMQSITLHNMQEIDYTLAKQADFNNNDKSSIIEQTFERLNSFKPKNNITVRTEVFCQGVKIGEVMTHFVVEKQK